MATAKLDWNPARTWLAVLGVTLLLAAILGLIEPATEMLHRLKLHVEGGEDFLHWVLAALTLGLAFGVKDVRLLSTITIVYGAVYIVVGLFGFVVNEIGPWHVAVGDNILHLAIGAVTIGAGLATRKRLPETRA
ncbi:MAG TPA: hypothetical protein VFH47_00270 [Candidatus Thermoplasmatota archaeon]|nr:hypothetical protein [Candidatus Thermoplasmatota archaeon]